MGVLQFLLFGALGGLARGLLGAYKGSLKIGNKKKVDLPQLMINVFTAMVVGAVVGMIVDTDPILALSSGYAGIDIIEAVIKLKK